MKVIRWASVATSSNQCSLTGRNCRGHPGGPDGGGKGVAALRNSAYFAIDPVVLAAITQTCRPLTASGAAKTSSPAPYRCAEKVIESACVINTAYQSILALYSTPQI